MSGATGLGQHCVPGRGHQRQGGEPVRGEPVRGAREPVRGVPVRGAREPIGRVPLRQGEVSYWGRFFSYNRREAPHVSAVWGNQFSERDPCCSGQSRANLHSRRYSQVRGGGFGSILLTSLLALALLFILL